MSSVYTNFTNFNYFKGSIMLMFCVAFNLDYSTCSMCLMGSTFTKDGYLTELLPLKLIKV